MRIGKITRSSSHIDYVCQVYQPGEVEAAPQPEDHSFGTFVRIAAGPSTTLVGIVYNTILLNPEFGTLGPRLSPAQDLAVFSPDYLNEKVTLVGIVAIGTWGPPAAIMHGVPPQTAQIDALVDAMTDDEVRTFHASRAGAVRIGYAPVLIAHGSPLSRHLLLSIIARLQALCPQAAPTLEVLKANQAWRTTVEPLG